MHLQRLFPAIIIAISPLLTAQAGELHFAVAPDESRWSSSGNVLECRLSQQIPHFGKALFTSRAGGGLTLSFLLEREPAKKTRVAHLRAVPPPWKHKTRTVDIARVTLKTGSTPVVFGRNATLRTLYELEKGMSPVLTFKDWADARDQFVVSLSAVHLRPVLQQFQQCTAALHPDGFSDVRDLSVYFASDSSELSHKARATLERIASYLEVDPSITHIILNGYSDRTGDALYNEELSQMRVDAVQDYLIDKGVPAELLVTFHHGARNKGSRASNRRVRIQLQR